MNREIICPQVRLIDEKGEMLGLVATDKAIIMAQDKNLDLVEISPNASPPVCKIMNFGKYKYGLQKKAQIAKKSQKVVEIKEIRFRPTIAEGDYQVKLRATKRFLAEGNKVRISLMFKGRELSHKEVGFSVINRFKEDLIDFCKVEVEPKLEERQIFMVVGPQKP